MTYDAKIGKQEQDQRTYNNNEQTRSVSINNDYIGIVKGNVPGTTFIHKFGNAADFDTGDGVVTIWDGANDGGIDEMQYTYSATAIIDSLSSANDGDTQDIEVQGLDANYESVTQTITLTGQTRKALTTDLIRVFRMKNVGSTNFAGQVYCYENTELGTGTPVDTSKIRAVVNDGNNQTLMSLYTVPAGKTGFVTNWWATSAGANKSTNYVTDLFARPFGQVFQLKHRSAISDSANSYIQHAFQEPEVFAEKTDIEMKVVASEVGVTAASISAGFDIVLIDN